LAPCWLGVRQSVRRRSWYSIMGFVLLSARWCDDFSQLPQPPPRRQPPMRSRLRRSSENFRTQLMAICSVGHKIYWLRYGVGASKSHNPRRCNQWIGIHSFRLEFAHMLWIVLFSASVAEAVAGAYPAFVSHVRPFRPCAGPIVDRYRDIVVGDRNSQQPVLAPSKSQKSKANAASALALGLAKSS
jgi:hypothetical protein